MSALTARTSGARAGIRLDGDARASGVREPRGWDRSMVLRTRSGIRAGRSAVGHSDEGDGPFDVGRPMNDDPVELGLTRVAVLRLAVGGAALAIGARPAYAAATDAAAVEAAARAFLESLSPRQRGLASFAFESAERTRWHWTVPASVPRNGLPLGDASTETRRLALMLLRASTSPSGYRKALDIMALQGVLQRMNPGVGDTFDPDLDYVSVFGSPGARTWGWRLEGHHLSRHFTIVGDRLVVEPFFLGAWPTRAGSAYRSVARGSRTMPREEDAAREIVLLVDGRLRRQAVFSSESLTDHVTRTPPRCGPRAGRRVDGRLAVGSTASCARADPDVPCEPSGDECARGVHACRASRDRSHAVRMGRQQAARRTPLLPAPGTTFLLESTTPETAGPTSTASGATSTATSDATCSRRPVVTEFQRYLAEEIAEDHADGLVSRREALRRLGLLGLTGATAASLLAAAVASEAKALTGRASHGASPADRAAEVAALPTREITFRGPGGRRLIGAWASARRPRGGVLVIHENRGLTDSSVPSPPAGGERLSALAIDLLSAEGGTKSFSTSSRRWPRSERCLRRGSCGHEGGCHRDTAPPPREEGRSDRFLLRRRHDVATARLEGTAPRGRRAVLRAVPEGGSVAGSKAAVLGVYAELDARVNASRATARAALRTAGLKHAIVTFPGVDHAFFNPTSSRHDPAAAAAAYSRMLSWFGTYLAT